MNAAPPPTYAIITKTDDKGTIPNHPIFEGYQLEGWVWRHRLKVGSALEALRVKKNGSNRLGQFQTSVVLALVDRDTDGTTLVSTQNSHYLVQWKPEMVYSSEAIQAQFSKDAAQL